MRIILSTTDVSKSDQVKLIFDGLRSKIFTLRELGITEEPIENRESLLENATLKAQFAYGYFKETAWIIAESTGFFVNYLSGAPGVHTALWARGRDAQSVSKHMLTCLVGARDRVARFETAVVVVPPHGKAEAFYGSMWGTLLDKERVPVEPEMPYSGIFVPNGSQKTLAEMTIEEKNAISHRGHAFRKVRVFLEKSL